MARTSGAKSLDATTPYRAPEDCFRSRLGRGETTSTLRNVQGNGTSKWNIYSLACNSTLMVWAGEQTIHEWVKASSGLLDQGLVKSFTELN